MNPCRSCGAAIVEGARFCGICGAAVRAGNETTPALSLTPVSPAAASEDSAARQNVHSLEARLLPGSLLGGRYRLVALLGRGGMGEVYRADDLKLGQTVALKFLPQALARDPDSLQRFYAEVRIGRQVSHPNVCHLYDFVEIDGHYCLSMEYVDGEDLAALLKRIGRLPADKAIAIAREIGAGLAAAHDKGVIHRDLKPANVMIDGKGRARITDFGIAALAEEVAHEASAGTPAYMAPEQLLGARASIQSDIYALGLVLYETFTGQRRFEASTLEELKALHAASQPPSMSSSVRDIPIGVERIVQRCLEREPDARPASVHAVLAALPGGDPLAAALAAGETPTPAMVAAAGQVGDLRPTRAWGGLLVALIGLVVLTQVSRLSSVLALAPPLKSTDVMIERARALLVRHGHTQEAQDSAHGFSIYKSYLRWVAHHDARPDRWLRLADAQPGPLLFYFRQSPAELVAVRTSPTPFTPADVGRVTQDDPPSLLPGMADVTLDRRGRLVRLRVVPPLDEAAPSTSEPDWAGLMTDAGFDGGTRATVAPRRSAPVDSDRKIAWEATYPGQPDVPMHVEAAAYHGKPVWFEISAPWSRPPSAVPSIPPPVMWTLVITALLSSIAMIVLSRRNLRLGRADRPGAFRLALFLFCTSTAALLLRADHVALLFSETLMLVDLLAQTLTYAFAAWLNYLALEPIVRRRWPQLMVGWSRLLAGRMRDPMVGRDLLIGGALGIGLAVLMHVAFVAASTYGIPSMQPMTPMLSTLGSARQIAYVLLLTPYTAVVFGIGNMFALILLQALLRRRAAAMFVQFFLTYATCLMMTSTSEALSPAVAVFAAIWLFALLRAGLFVAIVSAYVFMVLDATAMPPAAGAWFATASWCVLLALVALLLLAFRQSLGGRPMFNTALLDREVEL
jgi:serine/threonine-protein kinase